MTTTVYTVFNSECTRSKLCVTSNRWRKGKGDRISEDPWCKSRNICFACWERDPKNLADKRCEQFYYGALKNFRNICELQLQPRQQKKPSRNFTNVPLVWLQGYLIPFSFTTNCVDKSRRTVLEC